MATLNTIEQVTQRNKRADVSITYDGRDDSPGEKLWLTTTTHPYDIVNTKSVAGNQQDRDTLEDRIVTAGETAYGDYDLYAEEGIGVDGLDQALVIIGTGDVALAVANNDTETVDLSDYVTGGYTPLDYEIDAAAEDEYVTSTMIGSVLQVVSGASDGADTIPVNVTDRDGNTVQLTVTATVA